MRFFNVGIWTGIICSITWIIFDIRYLSRWHLLKDLNKWLKTSYRRSIVLDLAIVMGFFSIQARLLDMINGFVAVITTTILICTYNLLAVSKNKILKPRTV